jgi:hypothetical protein
MSMPLSFRPPETSLDPFYKARNSGSHPESKGMIPHMNHYIYKPTVVLGETEVVVNERLDLSLEESTSDASAASSSSETGHAAEGAHVSSGCGAL